MWSFTFYRTKYGWLIQKQNVNGAYESPCTMISQSLTSEYLHLCVYPDETWNADSVFSWRTPTWRCSTRCHSWTRSCCPAIWRTSRVSVSSPPRSPQLPNIKEWIEKPSPRPTAEFSRLPMFPYSPSIDSVSINPSCSLSSLVARNCAFPIIEKNELANNHNAPILLLKPIAQTSTTCYRMNYIRCVLCQ